MIAANRVFAIIDTEDQIYTLNSRSTALKEK
jgi:hypothetical protein